MAVKMVSAKNPGTVEAMICENVKNWSSVISYQTGFSEKKRKPLEKSVKKSWIFLNTWDNNFWNVNTDLVLEMEFNWIDAYAIEVFL